jgi:RimJ/RimL family protein N-acetyltransferase
MKAAVAHARSCGLCRLVAQVRPANKAMLAVFRAAGMRMERDAGETVGVLELTAEPITV